MQRIVVTGANKGLGLAIAILAEHADSSLSSTAPSPASAEDVPR